MLLSTKTRSFTGAFGFSNNTGATYGDDYTLEYLTTSDPLGHTLLTVGVLPPVADFDGDSDVDADGDLSLQRVAGDAGGALSHDTTPPQKRRIIR